ncbi:MATE family multidrug resistance protein [Paucibacter oligotrophus]|uniref:MATE family multidrug resistance protein n=1 Tax=Roseateles oligotrophus TaxID=1769250 RepID=A0A840LCQ2_9BURK|nr:MATE family efflux transporter [Roseateles oligotrophus]MBB4843968.1 MATE family multidrug resistance protein [Roseateles oligotrophus]
MSASGTGRLGSLRRLAPLAWPVFIGQIAVLANSTVDTVLMARYSSIDLAALAVGAAIYITVFLGLMGVVLAISPIAGQLFGAQKLTQAGDELHQALWLALGLSSLGCLALLFPDPMLSLARVTPEVEAKVRGYLATLALGLPPALLFTAYRGFNTAVSRPKVVMAIQLAGLALKVPLSVLLIHGFGLAGLQLPALGAVGCAAATALVMWAQALIAWRLLRRDPFYAPFGLCTGGLHAPRWAAIKSMLKLGLPMGAGMLIEVTGFTFMAIFIARLGATAVAGHQLAMNLVALMFMAPMALGNAAQTLVAQSIGAQRLAEARRLGWHSLEIGLALAFCMGGLVFALREHILGLYTHDPAIIAAAMPLLIWLWYFHVGDAGQTVGAFVLRAHRIATAPMLVYALAIWGVGIGGGYWLAFGEAAWIPARLQGAPGFWAAATLGLALAATGMGGFLAWVHAQEARRTR